MKPKPIKSPFKKIFRELILLKRLDEPNDKTDGGLIIPENQRVKPTKGIVIGVGEGLWCKEKKGDLNWRTGKYGPMELKVGDKVIFHPEDHWAFNLGGEEFIAMRESDLLCKIED
jgi:chaperonin GroES